MGLTVFEHQNHHHQQQQQQSGGEFDKKKKQRRSTRRSKPNSSPFNGSASTEIAGQYQATPQIFQNSHLSIGSSSKQYTPNQASNIGFNSIPSTHINGQGAPRNPNFTAFSKSARMSNTFEEFVGQDEQDFVPPYLVNGSSKRKCFEAHWSVDAVKEALQRGEVFQAQLRVNAHNRMEAYCTIDGVPTDILISGVPRQNRAVEGDVVAVKVDPPQLWSKMKGSGGSSHSPPLEAEQIPVAIDLTNEKLKGKYTFDIESGLVTSTNCSLFNENGFHDINGDLSDMIHANGHSYPCLDPLGENFHPGRNDVLDPVERLCQAVVSMPSKRPTGKIVAIVEPSSRRQTIVGFLNAKGWFNNSEGFAKQNKKGINLPLQSSCGYIHLIPSDPKLPKMIVTVKSLPFDIRKRLDVGDASVEKELIAARIEDWAEESLLPQACVVCTFGRGGEVEPRISAILFEYGITSSEFSLESLSCLPDELWRVPPSELECRRDIRNLCVFTIDPSTATDLDDALSVEKTSNGIYRIGVHIADVSYFVQPETALDTEAQVRSTSVYMLKRKLSMLPALLSEKLGSLIPGVDRLTFSIFWDIDVSGNILDRWVSRTVIRSCCKLSYEHAQDMIEGRIDIDRLNTCESGFPQLHGSFGWHDVFQSVKMLNEISKALKERRFNSGALRLDNAKVAFLLDEFGDPYDCNLCERKDANFLVEEFMLLANRTAAEVISTAFPKNALLRKHPKPNERKLKEFEVFCQKHGFELDASSSGSLNRSLEKIKEKLKDDPVLYDILINYATKPMQLAKYFCTGDIAVGDDDWGHYALAAPLYTHFTSPLRRYPDILVHRALTAAIEAEQEHLKHQSKLNKAKLTGYDRCFTGIKSNEVDSQSVETLNALSSAAVKYRLPCTEALSDVASYCNQKKLASRQVKDAIDRLYMWDLLRNKEIFLSEARVLGIGPRFMSVYIQKLAIERRIYYDEVDGLIAEWLELTSTLVLNYVPYKRFQRGSNMSSRYKALDEVAFMESPYRSEPEPGESSQHLDRTNSSGLVIEPSVFPITIHVLSTIPVALHAVGGDDGPLDIAARLYVTSYTR
ncbi:DIS3-like exonuclease 2 [Silene latifolia]|uniref:DIS3-like exonuclease 2 n=1 Tax=Silene latifolia TaxID=37657 RepID=UPI003D778C19